MRKTMATVVVLGLVWIGYTAWPPGEAPPVRGELVERLPGASFGSLAARTSTPFASWATCLAAHT
jgi:hypothetical protein